MWNYIKDLPTALMGAHVLAMLDIFDLVQLDAALLVRAQRHQLNQFFSEMPAISLLPIPLNQSIFTWFSVRGIHVNRLKIISLPNTQELGRYAEHVSEVELITSSSNSLDKFDSSTSSERFRSLVTRLEVTEKILPDYVFSNLRSLTISCMAVDP